MLPNDDVFANVGISARIWLITSLRDRDLNTDLSRIAESETGPNGQQQV
jgi:hypothetical protein